MHQASPTATVETKMLASKIRETFVQFFKEKNHIEIPGTPLTFPDPTLLFVNAGMVQFKPYFLGEKEPPSRRIVNFQKCFRTVDIEKVGTNGRSLTFFEMLGNWSIGDYWKEEAISWAFELLTQAYKIEKERIWVSVFKGEKGVPKDTESKKIWQKLGIPKERIVELGMEDNFWIGGPTGPCGPCTEIYFDLGEKVGCQRKECRPGCDCDRFLEIWNLVFMEYYKDEKGNLSLLPLKNVDTGAGLERLAAVLQNKKSVFETELFFPIIQEIERLSLIPFDQNQKAYRILADHTKAAVFLISEGVFPSNVERGYVLRRILRRAIRYGKILNLPQNFLINLAKKVIEIYENVYPELKKAQSEILTVIQNEQEKFEKTINLGLKQFKLAIKKCKKENLKEIPGKILFDLYQSYGFPLELTKEMAKEEGLLVDEKGFFEEFEKHKEISRVGAEKKFGGIGKTPTYEATKLHTATHLLHAALRKILGKEVKQMGSDITSERLRFDFSFSRKLTKEEIEKIENLVNQKIKENLPVVKREMSLKEAIESGALAFFKEKYPEKVTVYEIKDPGEPSGFFSKEICAGPHVKQTGELGKFKIVKEEAAGSGIRRIRAILLSEIKNGEKSN